MRPLREEDAASLFPFMSDPQLTQYLSWEPHKTLAESQRVVATLARSQRRRSKYHWTIFEGEQVRGLISLIDVQRKHRLWTINRAELAYWVASSEHGRSIATEAARAVVGAAFSALGMNRVVIYHADGNEASGRIPQKLGFRFVGIQHHFFNKHGVWHDMNLYEMISEDWATQEDAHE